MTSNVLCESPIEVSIGKRIAKRRVGRGPTRTFLVMAAAEGLKRGSEDADEQGDCIFILFLVGTAGRLAARRICIVYCLDGL